MSKFETEQSDKRKNKSNVVLKGKEKNQKDIKTDMMSVT